MEEAIDDVAEIVVDDEPWATEEKTGEGTPNEAPLNLDPDFDLAVDDALNDILDSPTELPPEEAANASSPLADDPAADPFEPSQFEQPPFGLPSEPAPLPPPDNDAYAAALGGVGEGTDPFIGIPPDLPTDSPLIDEAPLSPRAAASDVVVPESPAAEGVPAELEVSEPEAFAQEQDSPPAEPEAEAAMEPALAAPDFASEPPAEPEAGPQHAEAEAAVEPPLAAASSSPIERAPARQAPARAAESSSRPAHVSEPPVDEPATILNSHALFRQEVQRLGRARDWQKLAATTSAVIEQSSWATLPETRSSLLLDLARVYRDRLNDPSSAEETFVRLVELDAAHDEALQFLTERYQGRGAWRNVFDLYAKAIEATWDPVRRLEWTRQNVDIAQSRLRSIDLVIESWERLWNLGENLDETGRVLCEVYRKAKRWDRLAEFLTARAEKQEGGDRIMTLREVAEAYLTGLRDQDRASQVIDKILAARPNDPVALLALARLLARKKEWDALAELGARPMDKLTRAALLDFRRLVADALWTAGEHERAITAHERVLALDPNDPDALKAKEEYLNRTGRTDELVPFLASQAERATTDEDRLRLLARAAELAEKELADLKLAISLWEKRLGIEEGRLETYQALANLHEQLSDLPAMATALEGELALTREPTARITLLRRLGSHYAHRMSDDAKAEICWKEVLAAVPDDREICEELMSLHRRRGDFEGYDRTVQQQGWRAVEEASALTFWRIAATNIDSNFVDARRSLRAWLRVLDLSPSDPEALAALCTHHRALEDRRGTLFALEAHLTVTPDEGKRAELALEIARLWDEAGDRAAALAAHERVLRWNPIEPTALAALARHRGTAAAGASIGALDVASASVEPSARPERAAFLKQALELVDKGDALGRFFVLRRILWLSDLDPAVLADVARVAEEAGAWTELAAVYLELASETGDEATRAAHHRALARIYEERLKDPVRAVLALTAIGQRPITDEADLDALARLARATGRHEDLLALYDVAARAGAPLETRQAALRRRVEILEKELGDPTRAFHECARLLALDPRDPDALAAARRLAEAKGLWRHLDALYAELWDRATDREQRLVIAKARHQIRTERLADPAGALDQLLVAYRLEPTAELEEQLFGAADALKAWEDRVLPVVEARIRSARETASSDELARVAHLHLEKRSDARRAFELLAQAFVLRPGWSELEPELEKLAADTDQQDMLAATYRLGIARAANPVRTLEIFPKLASLYATRLERPDVALDVHRRILQLQPSALPSLEVVIEQERSLEQWRDLRESLEQWLTHTAPEPIQPRVARLLEIARLSRERLSDREAALEAYARILDVDPANEEAIAGVRSLTEGPMDPPLELRRLRLELARTTGPRRSELYLAITRIQEQHFADAPGAVTTLRALVAEAGPVGDGYRELARLLTAAKSWADLFDLIEAHAKALEAPADRLAAFREAVALSNDHSAAATVAKREALFREILAEDPSDRDTRRQLLALYRADGRFEELADLLASSLTRADADGLSTEERRALEDERIRVLDRGLGKLDEAEATLRKRKETSPADAETLLWLASIKLRREDLTGYLAMREQHLKLLPPSQAALVLCHFAEAADERPTQLKTPVASFYQRARTLDPQCPHAMEALKAIGRRAKSWRAGAALLPEADEAKLPWPERAKRLRAHGDEAAAGGDPTAAIGWYQRAIAVDPDCHEAWTALATVQMTQGDHEAALAAERASLAAFERATSPEPGRLRDHAERLQQVAAALHATGDTEGSTRLSLRAYHLVPTLPSSALAVTDQLIAKDQTAAAHAIVDRILSHPDEKLTEEQRLHATYRRGMLAARLGRPEPAIADLREALRIDRLHSGALDSLAEVLAKRGRVAAAVQHFTQALLVAYDELHRGELNARLGRLWEDEMGQPDEAVVCYAAAVVAGIEDRDLMMRALRLYRKSQPAQALEIIERLLPKTQEPRELANLWAERAGILADTDEAAATDAYDMALSYDPSNADALAGLAALLERRGEWAQLLELYEARVESASPAESATAYRQLARIARERLDDSARAERYLLQAVTLDATREDYEQLLAIYADDPARAEEKRAVIVGLLLTPGPVLHWVQELGQAAAATGERLTAWSLLSLFMTASINDHGLKATLLELRKEFEKADNTGVLKPDTHVTVRHPDVVVPLQEVLAELDERVTLGPATVEELGATGIGKVDQRTALGKTCAAIAGHLGLDGAQLYRAQELATPFAVLDADTPAVVIRAELLQLLSVAETNFLCAMLFEHARPGTRVVFAQPDGSAGRARLVAALLAAVGLTEVSAELQPLVDKIRGAVDEDTRARWADKLRELGPALEHPLALGEKHARGQQETARRVALVGAADLRFAARLLTRLDDTLPKIPTVGQMKDLEEFLEGAPAVKALLSFAAQPDYGAHLAGK